MGALLGYVEDIVVGAVMELEGVDAGTKMKVMRAFNKVLWIQNDLFARHYIGEDVGTSIGGGEGLSGAAKCPFSG
jgi:hypothetical protein